MVVHDKNCLQNLIGLHLSHNSIVIARFQPVEGSHSYFLNTKYTKLKYFDKNVKNWTRINCRHDITQIDVFSAEKVPLGCSYALSQMSHLDNVCVSCFFFRSQRGCLPWKPCRASMLLMMRKCMSQALSSAVFQLQTTALLGDGGSGTGCWRRDKRGTSSLSAVVPFSSCPCTPLSCCPDVWWLCNAG